MKHLALTAALGISLATFPLASLVLPALAQEQQFTVTITEAFAQTLATAANIPVTEVPVTLLVSVEDATLVCGTSVAAGETCEATGSALTLVPYLADDGSSSSSSSEHSSNNSAKEFAPGQLKEDDESAKTYAPGQTKGDGENASDNAPGHQKKNGGDDGGDN